MYKTESLPNTNRMGRVKCLLGTAILGACCLLNTPTIRAAGFTLITHGNSVQGVDDESWMDAYVAAVQSRMPDSATAVIEQDDHLALSNVWDDNSPIINSVRYMTFSGPLTLDQTSNAEVIMEVNWSALASDADGYSSTSIATAIVSYLFSQHQDYLQLPIHLIGHSRGGSVVSEVARLLGREGIWVDQQTTLDPHPVNNDGNQDLVFDHGGELEVDASVQVYENTVFADNYWENVINAYPAGEYIVGAWNGNLDQRFYLNNPYLLPACSAAHLHVYDWYYVRRDPHRGVLQSVDYIP